MLRDLLLNKKSLIVNNWIQSIIETYPQETSKFLRLQKDKFSNPVGYVISSNSEKIFDEITNDYKIEKLKTFLNEIIKIRAVQNFSPSQAVGFIFSLKKAFREELKEEISGGNFSKELSEFESRIDDTVLIAFDLYMEAREKIFQIRVNELKSKSFHY